MQGDCTERDRFCTRVEPVKDPKKRHIVVFTRKDLYRRLWETPIESLARELGQQPRDLIQACKDLQVPLPPHGYWSRKRTGLSVIKYRLPPTEHGAPHTVEFEVDLEPEPSSIPSTHPHAQTEIEAEPGLMHPIVAHWQREREDAQLHAHLERRPLHLHPPDWSLCERRRHNILSTLFRGAEAIGLEVKEGARDTFSFTYETEQIHCRLREVTKRSPESAEGSALLWWRYGYRQGYAPTGKLRFSFDHYFPKESGIRRNFLESQSRPMGVLVPAILRAVSLAGPWLLKESLAREEQRRRNAELARIQEQERSRRKRETIRWHALIEIADQLETISVAARLIDELERTITDPSKLLGDRTGPEWIAWARKRLEAYDPLKGGADKVFNLLARLTEWDEPTALTPLDDERDR